MIDYYKSSEICWGMNTVLGDMLGFKDRTTYQSLPLIKTAYIINNIAVCAKQMFSLSGYSFCAMLVNLISRKQTKHFVLCRVDQIAMDTKLTWKK